MAKKPIIIDTDPGIDDAVALTLALFSEQYDVKLISTLAGNVSLENTFKNALKLTTFLKKQIKIVKGASRPILNEPISASEIHGETGLDGFNFPMINYDLAIDGLATTRIHETIRESRQPVTLVGIGPLTDYAMFIRQYPEDISKIERFVLMGGAIGRGNYGVLSEFNFAADPEAAKIVFESGVDIYLAPLEVGQKAKVTPDLSNKIKDLGMVGEMLYSLFSHYRGGSLKTGLRIYDALAIAILEKPELFTFDKTYIEIETSGKFTAGASLMDFKNYLGKKPNAKVAIDIDVAMFSEWLLSKLQMINESLR
ncbi:nucleoside hydrolase [Liquorilactobacillus cacaonum]|nr:nucleoside hydrolase [Liquorilactobacillus cacaonum]